MNDSFLPNTLVSTEWLAERLDAPDLRIVDASWYLPAMGRDAKREYAEAHIQGAVFFDIDEIADTSSPFPHMLPNPAKFASRVRKLGIGDGNRVVVYDGLGLFSAPRVWWMFRVMGHEDVAVLDGGLRKWRAESRPLDDLTPMPRERHFTPRPNWMLLRDLVHMRANVDTLKEQVADARSVGRFNGSEPEPRAGLRGGHIPGSRCVPFMAVQNPDGTMKAPAEIRRVFADAGIDLARPIVTSCGSGVTAAVLSLALATLGLRDTALYDGSWAEWGSRADVPVEP